MEERQHINSQTEKTPGDMERNYTDLQHTTDSQPTGVYYTRAGSSVTRRQQKHDMLLTFMKHANTPKRKPKRTAPVKPTLLHSLLSIFL